MIGFFSALVETELPLRVGPGPLTIALDGRLPPPDEAFKAKRRANISIDPAYDSKFAAEEKLRQNTAATPLMAIGDSWLFDQWDRDYGVTRPNLVKSLRALGYKDIASSTTDFAYAGRALSDMAQAPFLRDVTNYIADQPDIKALLVGGGGNDVVAGFPGQQPLFKMLQPRNAGAPALIEAEVSSFIDGTLFNYYDTILKTLTASTSIPIILHAYDHPIPDGRGDMILAFAIGPWLNPYFRARGYVIPDFPAGSPDLILAREVMQQLIDRLNAMVSRVAAAYPNVHHVNLTGTLARAYGDDYARLWNNELHPKGDGYDLVAKLIETKLKSLGI
jgi:lysophospholipase L1-like esterase